MLNLDSIAKSNSIRPANSRKDFASIVNESYNLLFDCSAEKKNLHSLIESHIEDIQNNPRKLTELNRNLSILKALMEDKDLDDDRLSVDPETIFDIDTTGHVVSDVEASDDPSIHDNALTADEIADMSGFDNEGNDENKKKKEPVKESKSTREVLKQISDMEESKMSRKSMAEGECDSSKEICPDEDEEECQKLREADVRDFEQNDWNSFAGATSFADGSAPVIAEMNDFEDGSSVIVVADAECIEVDVYGADDSSMTYVKSHDRDPESSADVLDDMRDLVNAIEIAPNINDVTSTLMNNGFAAAMLENRVRPMEACGYKKKKNESVEDEKLREAEVRDFTEVDFEDFDAEPFADGSAPVIAETEIADKAGNPFFVTLIADAYGFELDLINENGESYSYMKAHETAPESSAAVLDKMQEIVDGLESADDVHAVSMMAGMEGFKSLFESKVSVESIKKFAENCKGKSFVKGLKESRAITESKDHNNGSSDMALYKAGCSMMTQMAIELEKNNSFRESFIVMSDVLDKHLDKMRESINKGTPFSKKVVEGLNMFYKSILTESDDDEIADFKSWVEDEYNDLPDEENFQDPEAENPDMPDELIGDEQVNPDELEAEEVHEIAAEKAEELIDECPVTAAEIATEIVKQLIENPEASVEECLAKFGYSKTLKEAEGDEDEEEVEDEETDEVEIDLPSEDDVDAPVDDDAAVEAPAEEVADDAEAEETAEDSEEPEIEADKEIPAEDEADEVVYDFNGVEISQDEFNELKAFLNIRRGNPIDAEITEEPNAEESAVLESKLNRLRAKK